MELGSTEAMKEIVAAGLGCAVLPRLAVSGAGRRDALTVLPLAPRAAHTLAIVMRGDKPLSRGCGTCARRCWACGSERIGVEHVHRQLVAGFDALTHGSHVLEPQPAGYALHVQVHRQRHQVDVAGALAVAEQAALDAVGAGHHRQFGGCDGRATVVVRMHAEHDAVAPRQAAVHPFDLVGVDVGAGAFHGGWQIDDHLALRAGVPDGADRVADLQRIVQLGQAECFGRILVDPFRAGIGVGQGADLTRAGQRQVLDLIPAHAEDDAAPLRRDRVVQVDDGAASAAQRFKGAFDQVGPRLGQHLDGDVVGNAFFLDELAHEVEVRVRGRWESASISFMPTATSCSKRSCARRPSGSIGAWLPSRMSVLIRWAAHPGGATAKSARHSRG